MKIYNEKACRATLYKLLYQLYSAGTVLTGSFLNTPMHPAMRINTAGRIKNIEIEIIPPTADTNNKIPPSFAFSSR